MRMTRGEQVTEPGPFLTVQVGSDRYAFDSTQAPVTIGRLDPQLKKQADIPIADILPDDRVLTRGTQVYVKDKAAT